MKNAERKSRDRGRNGKTGVRRGGAVAPADGWRVGPHLRTSRRRARLPVDAMEDALTKTPHGGGDRSRGPAKARGRSVRRLRALRRFRAAQRARTSTVGPAKSRRLDSAHRLRASRSPCRRGPSFPGCTHEHAWPIRSRSPPNGMSRHALGEVGLKRPRRCRDPGHPSPRRKTVDETAESGSRWCVRVTCVRRCCPVRERG